MSNKLRITLITIFLTLIITIQCQAAQVQYIIWGYTSNLESITSGVRVILTDVRGGKIVGDTYSDNDGVYMFWLYEGSGGYYNVSISGHNYSNTNGTASSLGATVLVEKGYASRLDLDYNPSVMMRFKTEQSKDYFCYITKTGNRYHKSGCSYLWDSCLARPLAYVCWKHYKPCEECLPGFCSGYN